MSCAYNLTAQGAIPAYRFVKVGTADFTGAVNAAATTIAIGQTRDVAILDTAKFDLFEIDDVFQITAGGTVAVGDKITSDSTGRGVTTTTTGDFVYGVALQAAVVGDVFKAINTPVFKV